MKGVEATLKNDDYCIINGEKVYIGTTSQSISQLVKEHGINIDQPCAGNGVCGKCKVQVRGPSLPPTEQDLKLLSEKELKLGIRLACQTIVLPHMVIEVENSFQKVQVLEGTDETFDNDKTIYSMNDELHHAIAIDIGTTTIVVYLVCTSNGKIINVESSLNPQVAYGADVISRINFIAESEPNLKLLQKKLVEELDCMIARLLAHYQGLCIDSIVVSGNSTMEHIFAGISPVSIGKAPFAPAFYVPPILNASDVGLHISNNPQLKLMPNISGFVGGDIVSGLVYSKIIESSELSLFIDIGTNNEMALGQKDKLLCCSAAAGPALEGANISKGMRAAPGAIEKVWLDAGNNVCIKTIDNIPSVGICGSGLIDIIALLINNKIIKSNGTFEDSSNLLPCFAQSITGEKRKRCFVLDKKNDISITQKDIKEFQLAKGAIQTGIELMMAEYGTSIDEIDRIFLAGAFGNYIDIRNGIKAGILPNVSPEKFITLGNSSGLGACSFACDKSLWNKANEVRSKTLHLELSLHENFQETFVRNLLFA